MLAPERTTAGSAIEPGRVIAKLTGITKAFGAEPHRLNVLHGIDLTIHAGQFMLIMGPSGSGKTTLLTILGLLLPPTSGVVGLLGYDICHSSTTSLTAIRRRHVSFIFQSFNLLRALTAGENVRVALELQGIRGREAKRWSHALLERVGLGGRIDHRPADMSGGEQQRVGVARALGSPAELLLADEPTGSLDGGTARPVVELLRGMAHQDGRAVVVVSHDPRLEPLADRIIRIEDGQIVADGTKERQ